MKYLIAIVLSFFTINVFAFDLQKNMQYYNKLQKIRQDKFIDDFNLHISMLKHPEITASETNIQNIDQNVLIIKQDYEEYLIDKRLNFAEFKKDLLQKIDISLTKVNKKDIDEKNINILVPHMIDLNKPKDIDMSNRFAYLVNVDTGYIFLVTPNDYAVLIQDIIKTIVINLQKRNIKFKQINYITPACGVDAKKSAISLKKYKTDKIIGNIKISDELFFVEHSDETLADKTWNYLLSDKKNKDWLKANKVKLDVSFCSSEHCYCRTPKDALEFAQNNNKYTFGELMYNGVSNFVLGAVSLWPQEKDYIGFVSKSLIERVQKKDYPLELKKDSFKHMTDNPTVDGSGVQNIKLNDFALTTKTIN
jgi:hypothetical protein